MLRKLRPLSKSTDLYILLHVNLIKKLYTNIELYLVWLLFAIVWAQVSELFFLTLKVILMWTCLRTTTVSLLLLPIPGHLSSILLSINLSLTLLLKRSCYSGCGQETNSISFHLGECQISSPTPDLL